MNPKHKPVVVLLSGMLVASLSLLTADTAWSEAAKKNTSKKPLAKKIKPAAPSQAVKLRPPASASTGQQNAIAPTAVPPATVASAPKETVTATQAEAAKPAPIPANPYLTVPQPNPWTAEAAKPATGGNPYLAYLKAQPAPPPWTAPAFQPPQFVVPAWINPFQVFQFPFPTAPVPVAQTAQPTPPAAPAMVNPYLAYRLPILPPTPWTPPVIQAPQFTAPAWVNPFQVPVMATAPAVPAQPAAAPALPAFTPPNWANNPYLAYLRPAASAPGEKAEAAKPPAAAQTPAPVAASTNPPTPVGQAQTPTPASGNALPSLPSLPPLPWSQAAYADPKPKEAAKDSKSLGDMWESFKYSVLPTMPPSDQAILPTIKTVYPTGEKPLKVLTFKCPTELVGVSPPTTKLLHEAVNFAFDGINKTNLLPFNMQQVCQ